MINKIMILLFCFNLTHAVIVTGSACVPNISISAIEKPFGMTDEAYNFYKERITTNLDVAYRIDSRPYNEIVKAGGFESNWDYNDQPFSDSISATLIDSPYHNNFDWLTSDTLMDRNTFYFYRIESKGYKVLDISDVSGKDSIKYKLPIYADMTKEVQFLEPVKYKDIKAIFKYSDGEFHKISA